MPKCQREFLLQKLIENISEVEKGTKSACVLNSVLISNFLYRHNNINNNNNKSTP